MKEYAVSINANFTTDLDISFSRGIVNEIFPNGGFSVDGKKVLVARIDGVKVEVFANEHAPPHFRVIYQGTVAK